jgi:hypothetical protein
VGRGKWREEGLVEEQVDLSQRAQKKKEEAARWGVLIYHRERRDRNAEGTEEERGRREMGSADLSQRAQR